MEDKEFLLLDCIPLKRFAEPYEVLSLVAFLCLPVILYDTWPLQQRARFWDYVCGIAGCYRSFRSCANGGRQI